MAVPIQHCKYCGTYSATYDGTVKPACPTCMRLHWAINTITGKPSN